MLRINRVLTTVLSELSTKEIKHPVLEDICNLLHPRHTMGPSQKNDGSGKPRKIPFMSRAMIFPMQVIFGSIHIVLSRVAPSLETKLSAAVTSAFFGLPVLSIYCYVGIGKLLDFAGILPWTHFWNFGLAPCLVFYMVTILLLDSTHLKVKNSGRIPLSGLIERSAEQFFWANTRYIPDFVTCLPWAQNASLPTDNGETYVFGCHPHGIHCYPLIEVTNPLSSFSKLFPNITGMKLTGLAATVIFKIPVVRELFLYMGYIDASRAIAGEALTAGQSIAVCVGGEEEALLTTPKKDIYVLRKRKGFVRLALSHGASLVPVLGIRANELYTTYSFLSRPRMWLQKNCGIALPIFHGRWGTPLPHPIQVLIILGEPIPTPKPKVPGAKPDDKLVEEYHTKYIEAVKRLHAKHAPKDTELIIQ